MTEGMVKLSVIPDSENNRQPINVWQDRCYRGPASQSSIARNEVPYRPPEHRMTIRINNSPFSLQCSFALFPLNLMCAPLSPLLNDKSCSDDGESAGVSAMLYRLQTAKKPDTTARRMKMILEIFEPVKRFIRDYHE